MSNIRPQGRLSGSVWLVLAKRHDWWEYSYRINASLHWGAGDQRLAEQRYII